MIALVSLTNGLLNMNYQEMKKLTEKHQKNMMMNNLVGKYVTMKDWPKECKTLVIFQTSQYLITKDLDGRERDWNLAYTEIEKFIEIKP